MTDTLPTRLDWSLTWKGQTWTESDITGGHFAVLVMLTGRDDISMVDLDPFVYADDRGAVSDVHGLKLMVLLQMFLAQQRIVKVDTDSEDSEEQVAECVARAIEEIANASMSDEILPALSFKS